MANIGKDSDDVANKWSPVKKYVIPFNKYWGNYSSVADSCSLILSDNRTIQWGKRLSQ